MTEKELCEAKRELITLIRNRNPDSVASFQGLLARLNGSSQSPLKFDPAINNNKLLRLAITKNAPIAMYLLRFDSVRKVLNQNPNNRKLRSSLSIASFTGQFPLISAIKKIMYPELPNQECQPLLRDLPYLCTKLIAYEKERDANIKYNEDLLFSGFFKKNLQDGSLNEDCIKHINSFIDPGKRIKI